MIHQKDDGPQGFFSDSHELWPFKRSAILLPVASFMMRQTISHYKILEKLGEGGATALQMMELRRPRPVQRNPKRRNG